MTEILQKSFLFLASTDFCCFIFTIVCMSIFEIFFFRAFLGDRKYINQQRNCQRYFEMAAMYNIYRFNAKECCKTFHFGKNFFSPKPKIIYMHNIETLEKQHRKNGEAMFVTTSKGMHIAMEIAKQAVNNLGE